MVDLMTQASPVTRTVTFRARAGHGQALAERLLHAAALVAEAPGCELWLVHRDQDDADIIRVSEMWAGRDGLEVLAFGSHVPGDGEMVSDWPAS